MKGYKLTLDDAKTIYQGPRRVWISAPSIVTPDEPFDIRISLMTVDGYPASDYQGELSVINNTAFNGLPDKIEFDLTDQGSVLIKGCSISKEGFHWLTVSSDDKFIFGVSNPVWVKQNPAYRLFWGDLHVHSVIGKCGIPYLPKSPDYGYWFARDILGHDFCAIADHAKALSENDWNIIKKAAKEWHDPGKFISILGFEGDYDGEDGGHYNLYFSTDEGVYQSFLQKDGGTLEKIFEFATKHNAIAISHHAARTICGRDFSKSFFGGRKVEPVMEVYSQWGSSEEYASGRPIIEGRHHKPSHYYRYALKYGYKLGVIGGSDSHCTTPGGMAPMAYPQWSGKQLFPYPGGVGAVYTKDLTRESLFEAIRARRCYASSLEKILVWMECENNPMGTEIAAKSVEIDITVAAANGTLIEVDIIKNGETVARYGQGGQDIGFENNQKVFRAIWKDPDFTKESSYYVRATQFDGDSAWSSPIWITPK